MKILRFLVRVIGVIITPIFIIGFINTVYQVVSGNVNCCRGQLATPVTVYSLLVPIMVMIIIFRIFWRKKNS